MTIRQRFADDVGYDELAAAFNAVYEDYVMPVNVSADWVQAHVAANDIDLSASPYWTTAAGAPIGLSLLGIRGERGWIGGFGIAKDHRGQGLSHRLLATATDIARAHELHRVQLEVITTNPRAIHAYEAGGFVHERELLVLSRPAGPAHVDVDTTAACEADAEQLLHARQRMPAAAPSWQREAPGFRFTPDLHGLVVGDPAAPLALCVYQVREQGARLADIAALDDLAAQLLLAALVERVPDRAISLLNEPEGSAALPALQDAGWTETLRQHEMAIALA